MALPWELPILRVAGWAANWGSRFNASGMLVGVVCRSRSVETTVTGVGAWLPFETTREPVTTKAEIAIFPREWMRDPASPWLKNAYHDVPWEDPDVVRAGIQLAQDEAPGKDPYETQARPEGGQSGILTTKSAVSGG